MIKVIDSRGTGKTSRLFLLAKENDGVIICRNPQKMREKAYAYGITGIDFFSYNDYIWDTEIEDIIKNRPVYIDEISSFIKEWDDRVAGFSESKEDE